MKNFKDDPEYIQEYHYDCDTTWKFEYVNSLLEMTNEQLFEEMLERQQPDEYDGDYSNQQIWKGNKSASLVRENLMPERFVPLRELNLSLYSQIENQIISWCLDRGRTAGSLTRDIEKVLQLHEDTPKICPAFKRARERRDSFTVSLSKDDLIRLVNTTGTSLEQNKELGKLREEQYCNIGSEFVWNRSELEKLSAEELFELYQKYKV